MGAAALSAVAFAGVAAAQTMTKEPDRVRLTAPEPARPTQEGRLTLFSLDVPVTNRPFAKGRTILFGGWQPNERTMIGVGLFSVPKSATANPYEARIDPMKDPTGKTSRVAAVGMSFNF